MLFKRINKINYFFQTEYQKDSFVLNGKPNRENYYFNKGNNYPDSQFVKKLYSKIVDQFIVFANKSDENNESILVFSRNSLPRAFIMVVAYFQVKFKWTFEKVLQFFDYKIPPRVLTSKLFLDFKALS